VLALVYAFFIAKTIPVYESYVVLLPPKAENMQGFNKGRIHTDFPLEKYTPETIFNVFLQNLQLTQFQKKHLADNTSLLLKENNLDKLPGAIKFLLSLKGNEKELTENTLQHFISQLEVETRNSIIETNKNQMQLIIDNLKIEIEASLEVYNKLDYGDGKYLLETIEKKKTALSYFNKIAFTEDFTEVVQMDGDIETIYKPIAPKKGLILTLAFMLGLMLSVFIVLVQDAIIKRKKQRYNS
jgi:LPS O-antigen subunit length determinant protein (WzzB/FepE family)